MSSENYIEGDLGPVFNQAEPLTLPVVVQLLRGRRDSEDNNNYNYNNNNNNNNNINATLEKAREQLEMLQETCADEMSVTRVKKMKLRLKDERNSGFANAHLANFVLDSEGNVTGVQQEEINENNENEMHRTSRMKLFEVVGLATLRPKSVEEAVILIPSLSRFEASDLNLALNTLESI